MNLRTFGALSICGVLAVSVPIHAQEPEAHEKCARIISQLLCVSLRLRDFASDGGVLVRATTRPMQAKTR